MAPPSSPLAHNLPLAPPGEDSHQSDPATNSPHAVALAGGVETPPNQPAGINASLDPQPPVRGHPGNPSDASRPHRLRATHLMASQQGSLAPIMSSSGSESEHARGRRGIRNFFRSTASAHARTPTNQPPGHPSVSQEDLNDAYDFFHRLPGFCFPHHFGDNASQSTCNVDERASGSHHEPEDEMPNLHATQTTDASGRVVNNKRISIIGSCNSGHVTMN